MNYPPPPGDRTPFLKLTMPLWSVVLLCALALGVGIAAGAGSSKDAAPTTSGVRTTSPSTTASTGTTVTTVPTTTGTTLPPQPVTVLTMSGSNKTSSDNFGVNGRWTIHADVKGGAGINVEINDKDGRLVDAVSFSETGDSVQRQGGTFFITVSPFGSSYTITVIDDPG